MGAKAQSPYGKAERARLQALRRDASIASKFDEAVRAAGGSLEQQDPSLEEEHKKLIADIREASESLPRREQVPRARRSTSQRTKDLFQERESMCKGLLRGSAKWVAVHRLFKRSIRDSCLRDYQEYVEKIAIETKLADERGDSRGVSRAVSELVQLGRRPPRKSPRQNKEGELFSGPQELAQAWAEFAEAKFRATENEEKRGDLPDLGPTSSRQQDVPEDKDLEVCLKAMKNGKATGDDQIPIEVYQSSPTAKTRLFALVRRCWHDEDVPEKLVLGVFIPLYKNKGSVDDMSKYRFICLLSHAYKLLSAYLLLRLLRDVDGYLPESQARFRS